MQNLCRFKRFIFCEESSVVQSEGQLGWRRWVKPKKKLASISCSLSVFNPFLFPLSIDAVLWCLGFVTYLKAVFSPFFSSSFPANVSIPDLNTHVAFAIANNVLFILIKIIEIIIFFFFQVLI